MRYNMILSEIQAENNEYDGETLMHTHDHAHEHHHDHEHHHQDGTPKEELIAMLKYMVGHNASHVRETQELAEQLKAEEPAVYEKISAAVAEFEKGNGLLSEALAMME